MADRISTLPDAVLCHILSFLKTKQAVATSILSNRWKHLWLSVPVLDFGLTRLTDKDANFLFNDFVSSVFLSRDAAAPIKSFHLYVIYNYSGRVNLCIPSFAKWINFVLQRGVEYLDLNLVHSVVCGSSSILVKRWQISMADRISTLPDDVLCHILSFLKTEEAVATSILSNRWKHLWLSVPVLDFSHTLLTDQEANFRFNDFVYSILLSRDSTLPIKKFCLQVTYNYRQRRNLCTRSFAKWINFVLQCGGLEYLDLQVGLEWPILPITIFSCTTLVVLRLRFFYVEDHRFSSILSLPSLKTLNVQFVRFPKPQDFIFLLANCPNLEDLLISDLCFDFEEDSLSSDYEEESLSCCEWRSFSLSNLTKAIVDSSYFQFPTKTLQNVQSLSMCILTVQVYPCNDAIPTFHNLTRLDLDSLNYRWEFLVEVLKHCPKLQELYLDQAGLNSDDQTWTRKDDKENWLDPDFVLQCLSLHLRIFHLSSFLGLQGELQLARYILKNARVLQTMKICYIGEPDFERLLSSCPRASSTCKLTFEYVPCDTSGESDSSMDTSESSIGSND